MDPTDDALLTEAQLRAAGSLKWTAYPDCIGAFVAEMDFGLAPPIRDALQQAIARGATGYPAPAQQAELATACARWQSRRYGWDVAAECIQPVGDVLGALEITLAHFVPPGTTVVLPTPAYMPFRPLLTLLGHRVVDSPLRLRDGAWRMDLAHIDATLGQGAGLVLLCNPHNPTGRVFDAGELRALAEVVDAHGARVFSDEIHAPLVHAGHRHVPYASVSPAAAGHAVTAVSASKGWNLPGLKCAQLVLGNPDDRECWRRVGPVAGHAVSSLGMIAATAAWRDGGPWLDRVMDYLQGNLDLLAAALPDRLPGIDWIRPQGTYLAWLDCRTLPLPPGTSPARFFRERARVAGTDGSECGAGGDGHLRLNLAMPRPLLQEAVERMAAALDSLHREGA